MEYITPNEEDLRIPYFKDFGPVWVDDEKDATEWYYCLNSSISQKVKASYASVRHLPYLSASGTGVIETEIAMAFLIKCGVRVESYFELTEYYERAAYDRIKKTPPYYTLPKDVRDKILEEE